MFLANDLEQILYGEHLQAAPRNSQHLQAAPRNSQRLIPNPPVDKERGLPLLDIKQAKRRLEEIILSASSVAALEELLEERRSSDVRAQE